MRPGGGGAGGARIIWPRSLNKQEDMQEHILFSEKGGAVDRDPDANREYGSSFGTIREGEQNILDNHHSQMMIAKNLSEWRLEVDYIN